MKKIAILGSTGSIGTQALDIIENNRDKFSVGVLSCSRRVDLLKEQINAFHPELVVVEQEKDALFLKRQYPGIEVDFGDKGLIRAACGDWDIVLNSLMGIRGLAPTYHGLAAGNDIAFANKETLVAGGELIMRTAKESGAKLLPVDSEHSAIFQCLQGNRRKDMRRILLTASGGPFRGYSRKELEQVTLAQALRHPKWNMGSKITIDSATMMNKGLEVIEAMRLYQLPPEQVKVVIHRQSIVHSLVEYNDGAVLAQLGQPDMRLPIQLAMTYPDRLPSPVAPLDLLTCGALTFQSPDLEAFPCLAIAMEVARQGGTAPAVMNAANEIAVGLYLHDQIKFYDIPALVRNALDTVPSTAAPNLFEILEADAAARRVVQQQFPK